MLFGPPVGQPHQGGGREVRNVRDHGDERVVAVGGHDDDLGAERRHDPSDFRKRLVVGRLRRAEDPHRAAEHVGERPVEAVLFTARHGVSGDEAGIIDERGDRTLDTPHIGDDRGAGGQSRTGELGDDVDGRGDDGEIALAEFATGVDRSGLDGRRDPVGIVIHTDDLPPRLAQCHAHGPTDQADTDDHRGPRFSHGWRC